MIVRSRRRSQSVAGTPVASARGAADLGGHVIEFSQAATVQIRLFGDGPGASTGAAAECLPAADPVERAASQAAPWDGVAGVIEGDTSQAGGVGLVSGAERALRCVARRRPGRAGDLRWAEW